MREESALGELEIVCENAHREPGEAHLARQAGRMIEDGSLRPFAFAHVEKIARTFVSSMSLCKSSSHNAFRAILPAHAVDRLRQTAITIGFHRSPSPKKGEGVRG